MAATCAAGNRLNAKKIGKHLGGESYLQLRKLLLRHGDEMVWGDRGRD